MALSVLVAALVAQVPTSSTATTAPVLIPPRAITRTVIDPPEIVTSTMSVTVKLRVDELGEVVRVELVRSATRAFDRAVMEGVKHFRFEPARYGGVPVPIDINFTQRFLPSPPAVVVATPRGLARIGVLAGTLRERGTRDPIPQAQIIARVGDVETTTTSDDEGSFALTLPPGEADVDVYAPAFYRFNQLETIVEGERTTVAYLVDRRSANPYEVDVVAKIERKEISRTSLRGRDLTMVPGTFGDPFRVIGTLPGAAQVNSLLPFPIVRGSSPGNTGFLIDGIRVPLLFHLLAGPSVVHPMLIDEIEFSPGAFAVEYGGYTGGIVDGKTRAARTDEVAADIDLNFFQVGGLVRHPLPSFLSDWTATVAGRYGYPGFMIGLATPRVSLQYWDYQLRLDRGDAASGFTIFAFGAADTLETIPNDLPDDAPLEPFLGFQFHRVDLGYRHKSGRVSGHYQLTLGYDDSLSVEAASIASFSATPRARLSLELMPELQLTTGLDGFARVGEFLETTADSGALGDLLGLDNEPSDTLYTAGVLVEAFWRPSPRWLIRPGVRVDTYTDTRTTHVGVDPRLLGRFQLMDELWIKGGVGVYHQPPRFTIPIPGLDQIAFDRGLLESLQATLGAELDLGNSWSVDVQTYFNWMDPIFYDVNLNPGVSDVLNTGPLAFPGDAPPTPPRDTDGLGDRLDQLLSSATGRSYGLELLVRRETQIGISGWLSYTLSRSERLKSGQWYAFDFDRTHVMNIVMSIPLPRRWQIGFRAQVQTGRPVTTSYGLATGRTDPFIRFDLRIDKTAVWNDWLLDFYVDISNTILAADEVAPQQVIRYVLPTLGFRARL